MHRGPWIGTVKDSLWHEMSGDVKVRWLLVVFYIRPHWPWLLDWPVGAFFFLALGLR